MPDDHPLIQAAQAGDLDRVTELLAADPGLVDVRGWMGITPLIAAAWRADAAEVVRFLLARGADPGAARDGGDNALHWTRSGRVAEALAPAAGPAGFAATYLFDETPLHVAAREGRTDVVRAFLAAGADPGVVTGDGHTPLGLADDPGSALLLIEAGAPVDRPGTLLHAACGRVRRDAGWLDVAERLVGRGADPGVRDRFGALPSDLLADGPLRDRLVAMVRASGREVALLPDEVAGRAQDWVVLDPSGSGALTSLFSGTVLVRWRLTPTVEPVEVVRLGGRAPSWGLHGAPAFTDRESVWLRDWADLRRVREVPGDLLPDDLYPEPALSPDGRYLVAPSCEEIRVVDLERQVVVGDLGGFGDWSVVARFSPGGRTVVVGNSMQGTCWLTALDLADGPHQRWTRDPLPSAGGPEIVSDVAFSPDGRLVATWVRPDHGRARDHGHRGLVVVTGADSGEIGWHRPVDDDVAGASGGTCSASLCFTPDGTRLAVGLDTGVLWLDATSGAPAGRDDTTGRVHDLAAHPAVGVVAACEHGLRALRW
ncbi:ankyrin repeat domain-containing protein [Actinophytocola sp. NPDC049390]|uniref:ankyrin repeat domain-containing protein n=1 Tax=Actinophytocola sp. NPDC049390 TaxID=3363894 RepID=UPI0037A2BD97